MLTQDQINAFLAAAAFENSLGSSVDPDDAPFSQASIAATRETLANFRCGAASGSVEKIEKTPLGDLHIFRGCQPHGKNTRRGDLMVMDFGDVRAAQFSEN